MSLEQQLGLGVAQDLRPGRHAARAPAASRERQRQREHQQAHEAGDRRLHRRPITTSRAERGDEKRVSAELPQLAKGALPPAAARLAVFAAFRRHCRRRRC